MGGSRRRQNQPTRCLGSLKDYWLLVILRVFAWRESGRSVTVSASIVPQTQQEYFEAANVVQELSTNIYSSLFIPPNRRQDELHNRCIDLRDECAENKAKGSCEKDGTYMTHHCARTCNLCHLSTHHRRVPIEQAWSPPIRSLADNLVSDGVGSDTGIVQSIPSERNHLHKRIIKHVEEQRQYIKNKTRSEEQNSTARNICKNYDQECTAWAVQGECEANPNYMHRNCALACFSCHELELRERCEVDRNAKNAMYPGDLNRMFERIVNDPYFVSAYNLTILSQPGESRFSNNSDNSKKVRFDRGPWVVQLDDFFAADEAERLIDMGTKTGFSRSRTFLDPDADDEHVSDYRTSDTAWCDTPPCIQDPVVVALFERMENLTHISMKNSESLQLLRYGVGGYYKAHVDYVDGHLHKYQGVRILTIFLYLNGGGDEDDEDLSASLKGGVLRGSDGLC